MPCKQRREPTPVSLRVSPIERVRAEIDDLFGSDRELADVSEGLARLGVCLSMQIAIEAEVTEFLAGIATGTAPGLGPGAVTGTVRPRSRPLPGRWRSTRRSCGAPTTGCFSAAGRRGVSPNVDLPEVALEYLFLDGSHFRMHEGARSERVLAAWGSAPRAARRWSISTLEPTSPPTSGWGSLGNMVTRGLRAPLLVVSDGASGLIGAVELVLPASFRQRLRHPPLPWCRAG